MFFFEVLDQDGSTMRNWTVAERCIFCLAVHVCRRILNISAQSFFITIGPRLTPIITITTIIHESFQAGRTWSTCVLLIRNYCYFLSVGLFLSNLQFLSCGLEPPFPRTLVSPLVTTSANSYCTPIDTSLYI